MARSRLMIVMSDTAWTMAALHLACAMSRRGEANVLLLKMIPVRHPALLGTTAGSLDFTPADGVALADMTATAQDYGVALDTEVCQYASYWHAVVDAAEQLEVTAVITQIPSSPLPYWSRFRRWLLRRQLASQHQLLLTLDDLTPSLTWTPSLTLQQDITLKLNQHQTHHRTPS